MGFLCGRPAASGAIARGLIVNRSYRQDPVRCLFPSEEVRGILVLVGSLGQLRSLGNSHFIAPFTGTHTRLRLDDLCI